jgi:hypothetical protein
MLEGLKSHIMRKFLLTATASVLLIAPALAQPPNPVTNRTVQDFQQVKKKRLAKIDAIRACVVKAKNFEQMRDCKPQQKSSFGS